MNTPLPVTNSRPATVTAAAMIQLLLAASGIVTSVLAFMYGETINNAMRRSLEANDISANEAEMASTAGGNDPFSLSVSVVLVLLSVVLAVLVLRGNNVGRILTWVVSGLGLACTALATGLSAVMAGGANMEVFNEAMTDGFAAVGAWYSPLLTSLTVASMAGYLAVIVLLALPGSHPYFRKSGPEAQLPPEAG